MHDYATKGNVTPRKYNRHKANTVTLNTAMLNVAGTKSDAPVRRGKQQVVHLQVAVPS